ncbi:hypothetical protein KQI82_10505 [Oscillibacter sp. MSJ-2]|uniref:Uncharacterized protein n=1 Tax=Dysosmobacter acutus TaxID=2841504 RepID=A0ABS6FDD6_9FIRM|nr:hypothetical protein [Dysosmobacter acutus]MBU5627339.1 hypothetical protein [Dysosmobacter acutus]
MNEWEKFDRSLSESLEEFPPLEEAVQEITPWRGAIDRIVAGLLLTSITLNFFNLQYILPAVGAMQLYLGFRTLRGNNKWFRISSCLALCEVILIYVGNVLCATPYAASSLAGTVHGAAGAAVTFLLFFCFRRALQEAFHAVGRKQEDDPLLGAMIWYAVILILALWLPNIGLLGGVIVLVAYVLILRSLSRVSDSLDVCGYSVQASPVRLSSGLLQRWYYLSLLVLVVGCTLYFNHVPVEKQSFTAPTDVEENLLQIGFPSDLLERLDDAERQRLDSADWCFTARDQENGGDREKTKLRFDTVIVRTGDLSYRIYSFFTLEETTLRSNWQNIANVNPDYQPDIHPSSYPSDFTCRILWTSDGQPYYGDVEVDSRTYYDFFGDSHALPTVRFSYPFFSEDRCGYMAYNLNVPAEWTVFWTGFCYDMPVYTNLFPYSADPASHWNSDWYGGSYTSLRLDESGNP